MKYFLLPNLLSTPTRIMLIVWIAAIPAIITITHFLGYGPLIHLILASLFALILEAIVLRLRRQPILPRLKDGSVLITALLLTIGLPPGLSMTILFIGIFFAVVIAKHLYGGLGHNIFNPAMVGYAILLITFPQEMTQWSTLNDINYHTLSFFDSFKVIMLGENIFNVDAITQATPLDTLKTMTRTHENIHSIFSPDVFSNLLTQQWAWINLAWLLGGILLLFLRVISGAIILGFFISLILIASIFNFLSPQHTAPVLFHLFTGATMMGAFFIATDPVTTSVTVKGRFIFGAGIGIFTYIIREYTTYPDGIAFAVLLMNMTVPLLNQWTTSKIPENT